MYNTELDYCNNGNERPKITVIRREYKQPRLEDKILGIVSPRKKWRFPNAFNNVVTSTERAFNYSEARLRESVINI